MDLHGKSAKNKDESLPKKMLGAWVPAVRKAGRTQSSLVINNFIQALKIFLKGKISDEATFKEWFLIVADEKKGMH